MKMKLSDKCLWAKKAAGLDIETDEGAAEFYRIARESGLGTRWLSYYANAYEAGGESGLKALSYRCKMHDKIRAEAEGKISRYLDNKIPPNLRAEIGFRIKVHTNRITVIEQRPCFGNRSQMTCLEVFQVRYTDYDNRWHLYWMRKFNKWWPYVPEQPVFTIDDCLREVEQDIWGCFWG